MVFSIFMKRIRDLTRSEAQELQGNARQPNPDPDANSGDSDAEERGNQFVIETRIVKLSGQGKLKAFQPVAEWLRPTPAMLKVAEIAKEVGTQLWFSSADPGSAARTMGALRLSGEITLCASLLQHLLRHRQDAGGTPDNPKFSGELDKLFHEARRYWSDLIERAQAFNRAM
jgi:hypothetical protein